MTLDILVLALYALGMLVARLVGHASLEKSGGLSRGRPQSRPAMYMSTMAATVLGGASTIGSVRLGYVHGISGLRLCATIGVGIIILNLVLAKPAHPAAHLLGHAGARTAIQPGHASGQRRLDVRVRVDDRCRARHSASAP